MKFITLSISLILLLLITQPAFATWSIIIMDSETQEIAIGSATCIDNSQVLGIDLRAESPIILIGKGAGVAQSLLDSSAERRNIIRDGILAEQTAAEIILTLITLVNTNLNQHGIVGFGETSATQTGSSNYIYASGIASNQGSLIYAVQGNVITGQNLIDQAINAITSTSGALPEKLMAAMEIARVHGGDGRCSCSTGPQANSCGSPPANFSKSAHVGYIIVARIGDVDDTVCDFQGCADGDYYMDFNISDQPSTAVDPVIQMQQLFDNWHNQLIGKPDGITSLVSYIPTNSGYEMLIQLKDWSSNNVVNGGYTITIAHTQESSQISMIGAVITLGNGMYSIPLTINNSGIGTDEFLISIHKSNERNVVIAPKKTRLNLNGDAIFTNGFE